MPEFSLADLVEATGGKLLQGDPAVRVATFGIDTRTLGRGSAFFALPGERTDGHRFLADAASRDVAAAVVERVPEEGMRAPEALIQVEDAVAALGNAGRWVRKTLRGKKWIAVTGSNGKTTTKELLASGLATQHRVHRTPGNFNNHLGVPLSLLACPDDAEIVVLELGMNAQGEIGYLSQMVDPDIGVLTNVRAAHLQAFDSLDDIAAAKGEMFAVMRDDATAVVNIDDAHVRVQATRHIGPRVTFGQTNGADLRMEELHSQFYPGTQIAFRYDDKSYRAQLQLGGVHSAFNALTAAAGIVAAGAELMPALESMEQVKAGPGRGAVHRLRDGMMLVDDSYNSSPSAMASVLETLRVSEPRGRRVLVMGDMLELGRMEGALHREAGKRAASAGVQLLFSVGTLSRAAAETARRAGVPEVHHHADSAKAAESIAEFLKEGDLIVVKGSRGMRMERVVHALVAQFGEA